MPTVFELGHGRIKVKIYFNDHNPPHVHVDGPGASAVFDIATLECLAADGFTANALGKIRNFLAERQADLWEAWHEYQS